MTVFAELKIRFARESDANGILQCHYTAVHHTASKDYPVEVLNEWSTPITAERIQSYLEKSFPRETTLIAEVRDRIVEFGAIVENLCELRAVYVHSTFNGKGIGRTLLKELERLARDRGVSELQMDSSITAEPFYIANGYQIVERGTHILRSGRPMACVKMKKLLAP